MRANRRDMRILVNRLESRNQEIREKKEQRQRDKGIKRIFSELNIKEVGDESSNRRYR